MQTQAVKIREFDEVWWDEHWHMPSSKGLIREDGGSPITDFWNDHGSEGWVVSEAHRWLINSDYISGHEISEDEILHKIESVPARMRSFVMYLWEDCQIGWAPETSPIHGYPYLETSEWVKK